MTHAAERDNAAARDTDPYDFAYEVSDGYLKFTWILQRDHPKAEEQRYPKIDLEFKLADMKRDMVIDILDKLETSDAVNDDILERIDGMTI